MINVPFSPPDIGDLEIAEVVDTLRSGWITTGPKTKELERQIAAICNCDRAACLNSATAALELTLKILGIGEGDEVITSAYTYTASASVIHHVGAKIVLIDTAENSYEMNYDMLEKSITEKTKAIIAVDLAGRICNYDRIFDIAESKKNIFEARNNFQEIFGRIVVIADAAHSFGAVRKGKISGEIADFTCFSFHAVKNITTGEGGAVTWKSREGLDNEQLYKEFMLFSLHGQSKDALAKNRSDSWEYDIVYPAYKCNMTDIVASLGLAQLTRYDEIYKRRKEIVMMYNHALENEKLQILQHYGENYSSSGHLYMVRLVGKEAVYRNQFITNMARAGIATNVHYKPLPMFTAYMGMGFHIADFPCAYEMYKNEITLPLHTLLTDEQINYVTDTFIKIAGGYVP